jgi:16S rRNA G966 N2-methylase RsmD
MVGLKISKILKKKGILVIHRNKKTKENISQSLEILRIKNYGNSKIIFGKIN